MELDARVFIKYLLLLCLKNDHEELKKLTAASSLHAVDPITDRNASSKSGKPRTLQRGAKKSNKRSASPYAYSPKHKKKQSATKGIYLNSDEEEDAYQAKLDLLFAYERQLKNPSSLTEANLLRWSKT